MLRVRALNILCFLVVSYDVITSIPLDGDVKIEGNDLNEHEHRALKRVKRSTADVEGDPHFETLDGYEYDFEGRCSYYVLRDCRNLTQRAFDIIANIVPRGEKDTPSSVITSVSVEIEGKYSIIMEEDGSTTVNGNSVEKPLDLIDNGEIEIHSQLDRNVTISVPKFNLTVSWLGLEVHHLRVDLTKPEFKGKVCGLLGNYDGNMDNDFLKPDGSKPESMRDFAKSWRASCPNRG
ncbi:BMP-binding endothelial regulator protein-like [Ptychodera flava]|uniref:BMP-binding endothelial regulator protein-like n=1 Tax=Ptychodera flava TaxID=63121 RepID=UPI00396AA0CA